MSERDPGLERLTNLTFAFLNAEQMNNKFLTAPWVRAHVAGYEDMNDAAFNKAFKRDRQVLARVGVPIETIAEYAAPDGTIHPAYRLSAEKYALPPVQFTEAEATVLGLAGDMGMTKELAAFARSGWTKIAASGATRELSLGADYTTVGDINTISAQALDVILRACSTGKRLTFAYTPSPEQPAQQRTMDPWGLVPLRNRLYLVGFDLDRDAVRVFRINRLNDFARDGNATHPAPTGTNLQSIVEASLRRGRTLIDALVAVRPDSAPELQDLLAPAPAEAPGLPGYAVWQLHDVDRGWLIRYAAAHAPDVLVVAPGDVQAEVRAALSAVFDAHRPSREGDS